MLQFVIVLHNVESAVDAIPQERCVLIAIILGSPLKYSHRRSFSFFLFLMSSVTTASWPRFGVYCGTSLRSSGKVSSRPVEGEKRTLSQSEIKRSVTGKKTCNPRHRTKALKEHRQHAQTCTVSTDTPPLRTNAYDLQKHHCPLSQKERESSTMLPLPAEHKKELYGALRHKQHHAGRSDGPAVFLPCPALIYL